jgi:hypothetical protein
MNEIAVNYSSPILTIIQHSTKSPTHSLPTGTMLAQQYHVAPTTFLKHLEQNTEKDMEQYASELALDYMEAYYQVSLHERSFTKHTNRSAGCLEQVCR